MSGFPMQLAWRRFVGLLRDLGYRPLKSHRGSVRQFFNPTRSPNLVSFHEPHSGDTLHKATLYDSLRKLQLSPDEFVQLVGRR
jgi:predicted RNA binding protein YcfA (HicA-like mRNA interferase family)